MTDNGYSLTMGFDGNLIMFDGNNRCVWETKTKNHNENNGRNFIVIQNDGNLVLYGNDYFGNMIVKWRSNTSENYSLK
jgi:hypothetical protein